VTWRLWPVAAALLLAAALVTRAAPSPAAGGLEADRSGFPNFVLFWPNGHQAVGSLGFQPDPIPHIEVYRNNGGGLSSFGNVGYVGVGGKPVLGGPCRRVLYYPVASHRNPWTSRSTTTEFACTTGTDVQIAQVANIWKVRVVDGAGELVLDAQVTPFGGTTSYNRSYCLAANQVPH
jgi:hypothetical protein